MYFKEIKVLFTQHTAKYSFKNNIVKVKIEEDDVLGIIEIGEERR